MLSMVLALCLGEHLAAASRANPCTRSMPNLTRIRDTLDLCGANVHPSVIEESRAKPGTLAPTFARLRAVVLLAPSIAGSRTYIRSLRGLNVDDDSRSIISASPNSYRLPM